MFVYDHLGATVGGLYAAGLLAHFVRRWVARRRYAALRAAYESAVEDVHRLGGQPAVVVRWQELQREFMRAWLPGWFSGAVPSALRMARLCALLTIAALILRAPLFRRESQHRGYTRGPVATVPVAPR
jgi:hypothetical protein